jgi:7-keto-8-aminopelargonate synthetase-like enzyme
VGKTGRGLEEHFNLYCTADFVMGSFSKALGSQGGFVAYNESSEKYLRSKFRQFEYSTSLSTISVAAALRALQVLLSDEKFSGALRSVKSLIVEECGKQNIKIISRESMILLAPCDNLSEAIDKLLQDGFLVVPAKAILDGRRQDCLRITPMALHTEEDIRAFVKSMAKFVAQQ